MIRHLQTLFLKDIQTAEEAATSRVRSSDAEIIRVGHRRLMFSDLYIDLLSMRWCFLLPLVAACYLTFNLLFAVLYYLDKGGIANARNFTDDFFFSVETMATIGYGYMSPISVTSNTLMTVEVLIGFIYVAFITGLIFAKFSRPTAQVLFSNVAVISNFEGRPHLKIRLANTRNSRIVDATVRLFLLRNSMTKEGFLMRRFIDLPVLRDHMPILRLTWTLMHPIDVKSPLYRLTQEEMENSDDELVVTLIGLDETLAQTIHARHTYWPNEVLHGAFFEDVVKRNHASVEIDYSKFHETRITMPVEEAKTVQPQNQTPPMQTNQK